MSAVWLLHPGDRIITAAQWAAAGVAGATDTTWNKANGWSIPASQFTAPQLAILAADGGFNTVAPDGANTNRTSFGNSGATVPASKADLDTAILKASTLDSGTPLAQMLHAVLNPMRRQRRNDRRLTVTTDITSFANSATPDATLTKSYTHPVTGLSNAQARALTAAEIAALPYDPGQGRPNVFLSGGVGYALPCPGTANIDLVAQTQWPYIQQASRRMMFDGDKLDVVLYALTGVAVNSYMVFVDGAPASLTPQALIGTVEYLHLVFPSAKPRLIEIRTDCMVGPIACGPKYKVWKPAPLRGPRVMVLGASYSAPFVYNGTSGLQTFNQYGIYQQMADWMDIEDIWVDGVGGTGFITRASGGVGGPNNNYQDRANGVIASKPDILIIDTAFSNDKFNSNTDAAVITAANTFFTTIRAGLPNVKIIVLDGVRAPLYGDFSANYAAIIAGLQALRQDLYYVAMAAWLDMAGYIPGHTTGAGNSDLYIGNDGVHPVVEGHAYLRGRLYPILQRLMYDDGRLINTIQSY